jgi:pimeloyl-ACP methyl ester carboxylesterase
MRSCRRTVGASHLLRLPGRSGPQPRTYTPSYYEDAAAVFLAMLEALDASPAHLVGFSDGGDISRSRAESIACPALMITGEHDFLATPTLVADMARAIPNDEFLEVKDASHPVHHEQPACLTETIVGRFAKR